MSGVVSFVASALMGTGDSGKPSSGRGSAGGGLCQMCKCECVRDNAVGCQLYKMVWRKPMQDLARWDGMGPWEWLWYPKREKASLRSSLGAEMEFSMNNTRHLDSHLEEDQNRPIPHTKHNDKLQMI